MKIKPIKSWTKEEVDELVSRALEKDATVVPDLIDAHIEFTYRVAIPFIRRYPYKSKDIICSAFYGLVQGCQWAADGRLYDRNIEPYIATTIRRYIRDFLEHDFLIPIPRREFAKRMNTEDLDVFIKRTNTGKFAMPQNPIAFIEHIPIIHSLDVDHQSDDIDWNLEIPVNDTPIDAMDDLMIKLGLDDKEIDIINKRIEGYTLQEIGEEVKLTPRGVKFIIDGVKRKLHKLGLTAVCHRQDISGTKVCNVCGLEKSLSEYYEERNGWRKGTCKQCMKDKKKCAK